MKITIARAFVIKKRITGKIAQLSQRITAGNSFVVGTAQPYDVAEMITQRVSLINALVELKAAMQIANQPVFKEIFQLAETKSEKVFYEGLTCTEGQFVDPYNRAGPKIEYKNTVSQKFRDARISNLENEIDAIQQKLDRFNNVTEIEIPDLDLK